MIFSVKKIQHLIDKEILKAACMTFLDRTLNSRSVSTIFLAHIFRHRYRPRPDAQMPADRSALADSLAILRPPA